MKKYRTMIINWQKNLLVSVLIVFNLILIIQKNICLFKLIYKKRSYKDYIKIFLEYINLFMPKSRREKLKKSYNLYVVKKFNKELKEKVEYRTLVKTVLLSEIIEAFKLDNIMKNGLNSIINNYKNIVIDKINDKIITNVEMNKVMNINDKRAKQINNCICYECSGLNGNGKNHIEFIINYLN